MLLDFHAPTKESLIYKYWSLRDLRLVEDSREPMMVLNSILSNREEEVITWARILENKSSYNKYDI